MSQLGPDALDVSRKYEIELLVNVEIRVIYPEVVPAVLSQVRFAAAQDHIA